MDSEEAHVEQARRRLGTVLCGKYTVNRVLGVGGMAVVYAATHRNQKQVAIKMLHAELSMHTEIRKRFLREGYVANSVKHRGAVDVIDDDVAEDGAAFIVMEYLDGLPVDALAERRGGTLPVAAALVVVHELCGVLAAAHERGIVHRDIKPANLFVTVEGELKVLDFGIARLRDASSGQATNTGMMLGTPAYMAPEQAQGQTDAIGGATDVWAAGASLFTLLTGAMVHPADNAQMLMIQAATTPPRSITTVMPSLPAPIAQVVDRALRFDRNERWASAGAMRAALRDAYLATFGDLSVAHVLAPLVGGKAPEGSVRASSPSDSQLGAASTVVDAAPRSAPRADSRRPPAIVGATTATPVSTSFVTPMASKKGLLIGLALAGVVGVGATVLALRKDPSSPAAAGALVASTVAAASSSSLAAPPAAESATENAAPTKAAAPATGTDTPTVLTPLTTTTSATPATPVAPPAARPPRGGARPADARGAVAPPASAPPAAPAPSPAPSAAPTKVAPPPPPVDPGSIR